MEGKTTMNISPGKALLVLSLLIASPVLFAQNEAGSRRFERKASAEVFEAKENYAVIVGVDSYDVATSLTYAVADARRLADFFESQGYVVELLLNNDATPTRILRRLKDVGAVATEGGTREQGNLVFAFSGHGFRDKQGGNYLATGETDPERIAETALALSAVQRTLRDTGIRQRVLFIDACRNDPAKGGGYQNGTFAPDEMAEGEAILYSTRSGALSWEDPQLGHGVFTHYLVEALQGAAKGEDGLVTFNDLQRYVVGQVKRYVLRRFKKTQIPYIGGERTGEFVLARIDAGRSPDTDRRLQAERMEAALGLALEEKRKVQRALNTAGFDVGLVDGLWGRATRSGIERWQTASGYAVTGYLDEATYRELVAELVVVEPVVVEPVAPLKLRRKPFEPEMVRIEGGRFEMGTRSGGSDNERPVRQVSVKSFDLGKYEVTFDQYDAYARSAGVALPEDEGWGRGSRPVINVSWRDAQGYIRWLNANTNGGYRLPSEAEWEYAARAGITSQWSFAGDSSDLCRYGNGSHCDDGFDTSAPVGSFQPNGNGLKDMHGNVWEWVEDCWHQSYEGAPADGSAWTQGGECGRRVLRGGSWLSNPDDLRSAIRSKDLTSNRNYNMGFRVSRTLTP